MRNRVGLGFVCCSLVVASQTLASVASDVESLTGARTKIVYIRSSVDPQYNLDCGGSVWELYAFDTAEGSERVLQPGPAEYRLPIITADGQKVIWSRPDADSIHMCNWDGSGAQELILPMPGYLPARATYAVTTAIDSQGVLWVYAKNDVYTNCIRRYRLDNPSVNELVFDGCNSDARFTLSQDMTRAAFDTDAYSETRDVYVLHTANSLLEGPYDRTDWQSCNTQMAPDNSYRVFHFGGNHWGVTMFDAGGTNERFIRVNTLLGFSEWDEIWTPRWSNDVRVFSCAATLNPYSDANVYLLSFNSDFTGIDGWVKVTDAPCSSMAHVWVQPPDPAAIDQFTASPAAIQAGASSVLTWQTTNATDVTLDGAAVAGDASQSVSPASTTTYELVASNGHVSVSSQVTVVVGTSDPVAITSFVASPAGRAAAGSVTLSWTTSNATGVTLDGAAVNASSSSVVDVSSTMSYTLSASGTGGPVSKTITVHVGQVSGIVAHYECEGDALDSSGNDFHGSALGGVSTIGGSLGTALGFNGTSSYVSVAHNPSLDITGAMTIGCWVKIGSYSQSARLVGKLTDATLGTYDMRIQPGGSFVEFSWGRTFGWKAEAWLATGGLPADTWVHLAVTRADDGTIKLYRDAALVETNTQWPGDDIVPSNGNVHIGGGPGGNYFAGGMDDVRIYGYALDAAEIAELHSGAAVAGAVDVLSFAAGPHTVSSGGSSTLSWDTSGATAVKLDGAAVTASGSTVVTPTVTTTYTLEAEGFRGPVLMTATVSVGGGAAPATIDSFAASPSSVTAGESCTLSWATTDADAVTLDGAPVAADGSAIVNPNVTTTYTLAAQGDGGPVSQQVTVTVAAPSEPATIDSFTADPTSIAEGDPVTLTWTTSNATSVQLDGTDVPPDGSVVAGPSSSTTYTLVAQGVGGPVTQQLTVTVQSMSITIISPAGGETFVADTQVRIQWSTVGVDNVTILYSADGGVSDWEQIHLSITDQQADWGDCTWTVPNTPSEECMICVVGYFGDAPAQSALFEIRAPDDTDLDGLDDAWELDYFGSLQFDGGGDYDGDGISNTDEYLLGTDPTVLDASSDDASPLSPSMSCTLGNGGALGIEATILALCLIAGMTARRNRDGIATVVSDGPSREGANTGRRIRRATTRTTGRACPTLECTR